MDYTFDIPDIPDIYSDITQEVNDDLVEIKKNCFI